MNKLLALKSGVLLSLLWALPIVVPSNLINLQGEVFAQESVEKKKTRKVPAMREPTYKKLAEAQLMIDPESVPREEGEPVPVPDGGPQDAVDLLLKTLDRRGLNSYEIAQVWNTLAFAYFTLDDMPNTIQAYENVLKEQITEALEKTVLRGLFQLYYAQEDYRKAIEYIKRWEVINEGPDANVTFILATAYYQLEDWQESLKWALEVEKLAAIEEREVKENWLYLQVVLYNEMKQVDDVIRVLERMVVEFPKKQYWMHLAGMYGEKEQDDRALSAYYAIYLQGLMDKESEVVMVAQRLLNAEVPYEAASVLEKGFKDGLVEENEKNLRLLATSYTMAQDMAKAIDAWRDATKHTEDGDLHYRLAQALSQEDRHKEAIVAYRDALDAGGLKDEADVHFWLGISLMQLEDWDKATVAFRAAAKGDKTMEKSARQYIRYIAGEKRRQEALKEMLES